MGADNHDKSPLGGAHSRLTRKVFRTKGTSASGRSVVVDHYTHNGREGTSRLAAREAACEGTFHPSLYYPLKIILVRVLKYKARA